MLTFHVAGRPAPKGSMRAVVRRTRRGPLRTQLLHDNPRTKTWQTLVRDEAAYALARAGLSPVLLPRPAAVRIVVSFVVPCPQKLQRRADARPTSKKDDLDKLCRTLFDALTSVVFDDDSQVVEVHASKRYPRGGDVVGAQIWIIGEKEGLDGWTAATDVL